MHASIQEDLATARTRHPLLQTKIPGCLDVVLPTQVHYSVWSTVESAVG